MTQGGTEQGTEQVLVLGTGPVAQSTATAFVDLGFDAWVGTLTNQLPDDLRPVLTVVCENSDFDLDELAELQEATGTQLVPSLDACRITRDREGVRRTAAEELGLPTMAYEFARTPDELARCAEAVGFPCVVKPPVSSGGKGQTVVHAPADLAQAWRSAREVNPEGAVAVERYVDFDYEVTIITARSIDPATGQLATWFCEPIGTRHEAGRLVEAWQPAPLSEAAMDNARSIAARITGKIGAQGVYSVELFVAGDDVYFSDVNPRPSLDGMITRATQRVDQFDLHARAVAGLPIDVTLVTPGATRFVPAAAIDRESMARVLAVEETGVQVLPDMALVRSTGDTVDEARERAGRAVAEL
ncbi:formate-dependent phosphoribosylglycinamide formyltransferase [Corynebacterium mycetoides]|uniref:Formate-dependent phosphoribosylglycinamide formyltransferase n=1 Tax=Corynebacterium mycetoides TaxID=38302 RepID=A0A1G9P7X9_9CORY|nr:ATP-grasp domain-containing protein [Corynebacterium mycetoides]SDL94886.1 formate-dependent phosphoribosylglycinamide formyltransferase [Corynebacterium mycetoides]